jgi:hypothetical protein
MLGTMETGTDRTRRRLPIAGALACLLIAGCAGAKDTDRMQHKTPQQAAAAFLPEVEQVLAGLTVQRESMEVRANRCEGQRGETADDLFYIWVGLRGLAPGNDIAAQIEATHARWQAQGWEITRFRHLDSGGVNLTALDPASGNTYTLDSGFKPAPEAYLAAFFNTPCFQSPEGKVAFGEIQVSAIN